jgi:ABC-type transporter Mla subunit MlaD
LLRQGDAKVFKKYSQMKLQMKREALAKLNRQANETGSVLAQHRARLNRVLAQWRQGTAKAMERQSINSFGFSRRFGRGGAI